MTNPTTTTPPLDSLVCVVLDIHLWSGRRKLTPKDLLKVAPEHLPPQDLASLGSKKICDPGELSEFTRLKRRAERLLLESGYRFLGGYGIPADKLDAVRDQLQSLQAEFNRYKTGFIARYDANVEQWITRHPEWETIIRSAVTPVKRVDEKIHFGFRIFRVAAATSEEEEGESLMEGAYHSILSEVAISARETWKVTFKGRSTVTQRALSPIRKMRDKLQGLSFVDPRIYPIAENIENVLSGCPKTGEISGGKLSELQSLVLLLMDPERMVEHGEAMTRRAAAGGTDEAALEAIDAAEEDTEAQSAAPEESVAPAEPVEPPDAPEPQEDEVESEPVAIESGLFF